MQSGVYWRTDGACNGEFLDEMEAMHGGSSPGLIHPTFTQHSPLMLAHHCHQAVLVSITSVLQWFLCPSITLVMQTWSMMNNTEQLSYILQNYYYCSSSWIAIILMNDHRNSFNTFNVWIPQKMINFTLACCSLGTSICFILHFMIILPLIVMHFVGILLFLWQYEYKDAKMTPNCFRLKWYCNVKP